MPRQGWETNTAGGKGPAAAGESDKSQPQPGCLVHPCSWTGPPSSAALRRAPGQWPGPPSSPAHSAHHCSRGPASRTDGTGHLLLWLAAAERSPASTEVSQGIWSLVNSKHQLCPPQTHLVCPGLPGAGQPWDMRAGLPPSMWQSLALAAPGACGCEHRQGGLAGRWIATPLQFCIPFLPDKPRRIFINQSATLFNKNLLTYK